MVQVLRVTSLIIILPFLNERFFSLCRLTRSLKPFLSLYNQSARRYTDFFFFFPRWWSGDWRWSMPSVRSSLRLTRVRFAPNVWVSDINVLEKLETNSVRHQLFQVWITNSSKIGSTNSLVYIHKSAKRWIYTNSSEFWSNLFVTTKDFKITNLKIFPELRKII